MSTSGSSSTSTTTTTAAAAPPLAGKSDAEVDTASFLSQLGSTQQQQLPHQPSALSVLSNIIPQELRQVASSQELGLASSYFHALQSSAASADEFDARMAAVCAFCAAAARPLSTRSDSRLTLSAVTSAVGIPLVSVFEPLRRTCTTLALEPGAEPRLLLATKAFVVTSLLREKYARVLASIMRPATSSEDAAFTRNITALGWLLFILVRQSLPEPDLATGLNVLLCCANLAYANSPISICQTVLPSPAKSASAPSLLEPPPVPTLPLPNPREHTYSLEWICRSCEVSYKEVLEVQLSVFTPFVQALRQRYSVSFRSYDITRDALKEAAGLPAAQLEANLKTLDALYSAQLLAAGDFDERIFLEENRERAGDVSALPKQSQAYWHYTPPSGIAPATAAATAAAAAAISPMPLAAHSAQARMPMPSTPAVERKILLLSPAARAKVPQHRFEPLAPATPMRATFATLTWLSALSSASDGLSEGLASWLAKNKLGHFHKQISEAVAAAIAPISLADATAAPASAQDVIPPATSVLPTNEPAKRKELCGKVFYRFLEQLVNREVAQQKSPPSATPTPMRADSANAFFTALLSNAQFIRSLVAVSVEIVAYSCKVLSLSFPRILAAMDVSAIEFLRILGNVLSLESERFPLDIVRHMQDAEAQLLDSLCWTTGSRLPKVFDEVQPAQIRALAYWVAPSPAAAQLYGTAQPGGTTTAAATHQQQIPRLLLVPLRKFFSMCAKKLPEQAGDMEPMLVREAWDLFVHVVTEHHALLQDNHASAVLLCAIHAVLQANERQASFRALLSKGLPKEAWSSMTVVAVKEGAPAQKGDITAFYNKVFVPATSAFIAKIKQVYTALAAQFQQQQQQAMAAATLASAASRTGLSTPPRVPRTTPGRGDGLTPGRSSLRFTSLSPKPEATPMKSYVPLVSPKFEVGKSPVRELRYINQAISRPPYGLTVRPYPAKVLDFTTCDALPAAAPSATTPAAAAPVAAAPPGDCDSAQPAAKRKRPSPEPTPPPTTH